LRFGFDSSRSRPGSAAEAASARLFVLMLIPAGFLVFSGCAVFRHKGPTPEGVAASRELSRQGVAAMETGQWQQAEDLLRKALQTSPDDASTHRSMAEALWHRGARQEAIAQIEEAIEHDSNNSSLRVRAGEMDLATGATDAALTHAERAIRSDPRSAAAWALRGRCFLQKNQGDRALADLQHSLEFAPDDADVLLDVAMIYRQRGQAARSLTTVHHLLDTYPPGEESQQALTLEGLALLDLKRPQQACEVFAAAAKHGPPTADSLYNLAQAYSAAGDIGQAAATAQQALVLNASHQPSRELLTQLAARVPSGGIERR
jgi:tetratricopeptide (TPR) repeat protein